MTEDMRERLARAFQAYGRPLETVKHFKYLGRVLRDSDDDWMEVVGNLRKVRTSWARLSIILGREGASTRVSGISFNMVVQAVLLLGAEMWEMAPCMGRALGGFQHRVAR